jgi:GT2 family glycosyltransferase
MIDLAVCMAAHNRREQTLACLASLYAAKLPPGAALAIYLLDDGSTDGTAQAVETAFPQVRLFSGDGHLYWAGGMRKAYGAALAGPHSHFLWVNDDIEIKPDALTGLLSCYDQVRAEIGGEHIVVGAMLDPTTGRTSYGGLVKASSLLPWKLRQQLPDEHRPLACDTINGNLTLIPRPLALRLGNIDAGYTHAFGDLDYGYRARRSGAGLWIAPGHSGYCAANFRGLKWRQRGLSLAERFRMILGPLGVPIKDQLLYSTRHFPLICPVVALAPYVMVVLIHFRLGWKVAPIAK